METNKQQPQQRPNTVPDRQESGPSKLVPNKVIVSGFPDSLRARQLEDLFPGSRVETLGWRRATLRFPSGAEAEAAMTARVCLNGAPLTVMPKTDRPPRNAPQDKKGNAFQDKKGNRRRLRPPEKELDPALDPRNIDFTGDFHTQLDAVLAHVRLSQEEVARISQLFEDVECVLQEYWPGCTAHPFGSITSGLGVKGSDADCLVLIRQQDQHTVSRASRLLRQYPDTFRQVVAIPGANTPIVKFLHVPTHTSADVSFKTTLGVRNSQLLAFLLRPDRRALPAAVCVKYWGRVGGFTGSGKLTNYTLTLMMLFYLQSRGILPAVCWLQRDPATAHMVDGWNTGFDERYEALPPITCDASIADLIGGFFEFYSKFNFDEDVVSPYLGRAVKKSLFADPSSLPDEYELYKRNVLENRTNPLRARTPVCVQDPFEQCHNVASVINEPRAREIKAFLAFAAEAYKKERDNNCVGFLKKILLEKPVIQVKKKMPEYRVVMRENYLCLLRGEWQGLVRDTALQVFQKILKLTLVRVDEKEMSDDKKPATVKKERYLGVLTKAIWRRKQVARDLQAVKCSFVERQSLITEEILKTDTREFNVPFKLEIQISTGKARRAVVAMRAAEEVSKDSGMAYRFRDFGEFFLAVVQGWIYQMLEPHLIPLKERCVASQRKENTPPRDNGEQSSDEEYECTGSIVVYNSAQTNGSKPDGGATVADITESVKNSLGLSDEIKINTKLDKNTDVDNKELKLGETSGAQPIDIEHSSLVHGST